MQNKRNTAWIAAAAAGAISTLSLITGCNTSHMAAQAVPAERADYITAGQPVDNQGDNAPLGVNNRAPYRLQTSTTVIGGTGAYSTTGTQETITQETFDSPDAAMQALVAAVNDPEKGGMQKLFGPQIKELVSGDPVQDKNNYQRFAERAKEKAGVQQKNGNLAVLYIGQDDYPFAIPIVKRPDGKWFYDTEAGKAEILTRRIGADELAAISFCNAYVQGQREYAAKDRDGNEVLNYAQRLNSSPGKKDGLYWSSADVNDQSPFGPLVADASAEGYGEIAGGRKNPTPYHGYIFRILKAQGKNAPGGAYNYVINGNMIAGFALVAAPAEYGQSGIMTFIVSHQGKVYEKDLGPQTSENFKAMTEYNPDGSWKLVK